MAGGVALNERCNMKVSDKNFRIALTDRHYISGHGMYNP